MKINKILNKSFVVFFICLLIFPITYSIGKNVNHDKSNLNELLNTNISSESHNVLIEFATQSTVESSTTSNQLLNMFLSENYDFHYITLVSDKNHAAAKRIQELGINNYPNVIFDGGYITIEDEQNNAQPYIDAISDCYLKDIQYIDITLEAYWNDCPCSLVASIDIGIYNNDISEYHGRLLISVIEINSRWKDNNGKPYNFALLDIVCDEQITIGTNVDGSYLAEFNWVPADTGFPDIDNADVPNLLIVASIFSNETGFADETVISQLIEGNHPEKPTAPKGETNGKIGNTYFYKTSSTHPDGNKIKYGWDWNGDYMVDEYTDFYTSGEEITTSHTWSNTMNNEVHVIASDENRFDSFWSDPLPVSMPRNKRTTRFYILLLNRISEQFPLMEKLINIIKEINEK